VAEKFVSMRSGRKGAEKPAPSRLKKTNLQEEEVLDVRALQGLAN